MEDRALLRQIDCCRPDGRDLDQAELADLAARAADDPRVAELLARGQAFDRCVVAALEQAPLPVGLEGRLLAALAAAEAEAVGQAGAVTPSSCDIGPQRPSPAAEVVPLARPPRSLRRRVVLGLAIAATVAFVTAGTALLWPRSHSLPELKAFALDFYLQDEPRQSTEAPPDYPASGQIALRSVPAPRRVDGFLGGVAAAFDLRASGGVRATLYVANLDVAGLPSSPPSRLGPTTGRQAVVAWQEGELVYVLVVEGGEREYRRFIPSPTIA